LITYCDGEIGFKDVFDVIGLVDWQVLHNLCDAILAKDVATLLTIVEDVVAAGKDLSQFVQEILRYFRNLLVCKTAQTTDLLHLPEEETRAIQERSPKFALTSLIRMVEQFAELTSGFDSQLAQRIALEALLIRVSKASTELSVDGVLEKLLLLEQGGSVQMPSSAEDRPPDPPKAGAATSAPPPPAQKQQPAPVKETQPPYPEPTTPPTPAQEPQAPPKKKTPPADKASAPTSAPPETDPRVHATVNIRAAREVMENAQVAKVLDLFKGRIVEITDPVQPGDSA